MSEVHTSGSRTGSGTQKDSNNLAFAVRGLDMVGPFKPSQDKKTHLLVDVDKFTKWVEAEPNNNCDAATAVKFLKKLIFRFGFPHNIITDNRTNLSKGAMAQFCQREHIRLDVASVAHPQSNGQDECANQEILRGIKPRLLVPLQRTSVVGSKCFLLYYGA